MERERTFRKKLKAHSRLLCASFANAMRDYFSVRTRAAMRIIGSVMEVAVWGYLGTLFANPALLESLKEFYMTPDMVTFMLSGLIINRMVDMAQLISPWFFRGSYRIYHNRPFNIWVVALAKNLDSMFFWRLVGLVTYIAFATVVFDVRLNLLSLGFWVVIGLGALFRLGLNLFTAGWVTLTKGEEDPVNWFYSITSRLFTGEIIPVNALPSFLGYVSLIHPKTYVQRLGRQTAVGGATLGEILPKLMIPTIAAVIFIFLGYFMLRVCIKRAKREGTMKW